MSHPRTEVFVSYAREDRAWKNKLFVPPLRMTYHETKRWDDGKVKAGDDWEQRIQAALASARVAVLLVSRHFLDSPYIRQNELPFILERAGHGKVTVVWVPIAVTVDDVKGCGLESLQAVRLDDFTLPADPADCGPGELKRFRDVLRREIDPIGVALLASRAPKYKIERKIGEGCLTCVYLAHDAVLRRRVAIKALLRSEARDDFLASLYEATKVADEPNFLALYGAWDKDPPHCVMQHVDGDSLRDKIDRQGALEIVLARSILLSVGDALLRAHARGYSHGNLKPSNILLTKNDEPLISPLGRPEEFRGERLLARLKAVGASLDPEEIAYLLPESLQRRSERLSPLASDQYLLGLMAYEMLTGRKPPVLQSLDALVQRGAEAFVETPPIQELRPECPKRLAKIIARMAALRPEQRYPSLEEALDEVRRMQTLGLEVAAESYRRCCRQSAELFRAFYSRFLSRCGEEAQRLFATLGATENERWQRQHQLMTEAIPLLLAFAALREWDEAGDKRTYHEPNVLTRIAREHRERRIPDGWYDAFREELIDTVCGDPLRGVPPFDPDCSETSRRLSIQGAWKAALSTGIDYIRNGAPSGRE